MGALSSSVRALGRPTGGTARLIRSEGMHMLSSSRMSRTAIPPGVLQRRPSDDGRPPPRPARGLLLLPMLAVGLLVFMAGPAAALASECRDAGHAPHRLGITALDFSYDLSSTEVASGLVTTVLYNDGDQPHQAQLGKFLPGKGVADFTALLTDPNPGAVLSVFESFTGGPNVVAPGDSQTTKQDLDPGDYLVLCFVTDPATGMPHFAMGMYAGFSVVGEQQQGDIDASQQVSAIDDMRFVVPDELRTDSLVQFDNHASKDVHEFTIGRLHEGMTADDVQKWAAGLATAPGPAPFDDAGGAGALSPGGREWFRLDLEPGRYVALCLVPDDETGIPHAATGMVAEFRVVDD
jgi:hypothetical protein